MSSIIEPRGVIRHEERVFLLPWVMYLFLYRRNKLKFTVSIDDTHAVYNCTIDHAATSTLILCKVIVLLSTLGNLFGALFIRKCHSKRLVRHRVFDLFLISKGLWFDIMEHP
ncbi:hypothetical protein AB4K20DRAFT_1869711 [Rhizopus microsporus]|uniref:Uncharacterized protein n=1 Tax=Rhizopus microsporus TaxID=58291 RepID=A0A1X0SC49_RHIZD|nr:hypothetical protein BCV71DRAFT_231925 [Rhizopus microsporus]